MTDTMAKKKKDDVVGFIVDDLILIIRMPSGMMNAYSPNPHFVYI